MGEIYDLWDISQNDISYSDVSDNAIYNTFIDIDNSDTIDLLHGISDQLKIIDVKLGDNSPSEFSNDRSIVLDRLRCYYFRCNGEYVYVPYDKVEYLEESLSGELINISSGTITCYSMDYNGNPINQYRLQPFSKTQQYVYGYDGQSYQHWYWTNVYVNADESNLRFGQTGISNITDFLLFGIMAFVCFIAFFKRR